MTYVNGRTIGTTAKLEENWANAVTKVSRWYNPSGKLIPKSKVPSLFKLVTKEKIYIGDCLEEGTVSPEDTALIEMVSRSKWAAMCLGQKWLKQINVNPLIHYNEQGQANARPLPYDDQSETRYALGLLRCYAGFVFDISKIHDQFYSSEKKSGIFHEKFNVLPT